MTEPQTPERHSHAADAELIDDPIARANREAQNGLTQFDLVSDLIDDCTRPDRRFRFRLSHILTLHRAALEGISAYAGNFRPADIEIRGSKHEPVGAHLVPGLVEDLCDYVNDNWETKSAIHLAAFVMWRLNWIHPFTDGNGRTSRALSHFILCVKLGSRLPGANTIPEQISTNKTPYYRALEDADVAYAAGTIDVSALETLLGGMLAVQLTDLHNKAIGASS